MKRCGSPLKCVWREPKSLLRGAAQASDNTLSVEAKTITASGRWVGASVESYASALAQGNELNVIADELIASSSPGEGITEFSGSLVDGPTGAAYGSRVNMQIGNVSVQEMAIYGAQVSGESAEALNNRVAVRFDELSAERLNLYGARAETWPASMSEQTSAQAIASGNELSVVFGTFHGDSDITAAAGKAEASGQNAVSVADGNSTTIEIDEIVASSSVPIIDIQGGVSSAGNEMGDPLSLSAQASASGNELSGVFGSVNSQSTDYVNLVAGNALAYGQNAVAAADSNRLTFDVSSLLSSQHFAVTGGMSVTGLANAASLFLSARASASGNAVSGRFESIRNSDISMVAGSAVAYGQDAVSSADGNRLSFEIETSVSNSTLEVQGGRATAGIASGDLQSAQASASGNLVTGVISGSVDQSLALGIYSGQAVAAAQNSSAVADNNRVQLSLEGVVADSPVSLLLSGAVVQAQTRAAAGGNLVVVSGKDTAVEGTLNGAQVTVQRSGTESSYADASGNRVEVSGIKLTGSITGAQVRNENQLGSAVAEGNVVVISNSTIEDNVTGANLLGSHINASGNTVILGEGTVVNGNVTAVVSANAELARSSGGESAGTYIDNRVVMNNATVSGAVSVVSSNSGSSQVDIQTAGNTLVLAGHNEAGWIEGFDRLDMTLSSKDESVLTLTERHESSVDGASIVIRVNDVNDQGTLIEVAQDSGSKLTFNDTSVELRGTFIKKIAQNVNFTVESGEDNALTTDSDVLASAKVQATESASSLSESLLGTVAFVRQGAEFVADDGLAAMEYAARSKQGLNAFAVMQGSSMHYDALSGVDVSGFTLLAGAAVQQGNLTFASFVESGWGNSEGDIAKNSTDLSYFGVGLAARYRFESGFYGEGAVRLGRASSDFAASFVEEGDRARYESDVFYATMHMAAGYELPLNDFVTADMYARYTFSFLDNDSVDLNDAAQSRAELDSVVAHALRIGARVKGGFTDAVNWKAGIAYEHMFDGAAGGTVDGVSITEAEMDGGSVIGELGVSVKPGSETSPWTLQFALKGYLGEREGVSGNGILVYSF